MNSRFFAALHAAALTGSVDDGKRLIVEGSDLDLPARGFPPHVFAELVSLSRISTVLLRHVVRKKPCYPELTPLMIAAARDHDAFCRLLVEAGATIDAKTVNGTIALQLACATCATNAGRVLLAAGSDPHQPDNDGRDAVMVAASAGATKLVADMLAIDRVKAYINRTDHHGLTAVHHASAAGMHRCVEFLVAAGASVNSVDSDGWSPTIAAAANGHVTTVVYLIEAAGADPHLCCKRGRNSLFYATLNGHLPVSEYLQKRGVALRSDAVGACIVTP
jgi:ankyrin repeat protein